MATLAQDDIAMASDDPEGNPWVTLRENLSFDGAYFGVRTDTVQFGHRAPRAYTSIRTKFHGVVVAPVDDQGHTVIVGQYRYVLGRYSWETPGGGAPAGVEALNAAKTELSEETGWRADHWLQIYKAPVSPGLSDEITPGYIAWGIKPGEPHPDPEERLVRRRLPFAEAISMTLRGEITHTSSIALLLAVEARWRRGDLPADLMELLALGGVGR